MGMSPNEFVANLPRHFLDGEAAFFARDLGVNHHLEQEVAELFPEIRIVLRPDRCRHFIGFLEQSRDERAMRLLAIPRTTAGRAQPTHDFTKTIELFHRAQILQSERWLPNSEISPEVLRPT